MMKLVSISPDNTLGVIGEVDITTKSEIEDIVSKATKSFKAWSKLDLQERVSYLERLYKEFEKNKEELAEMGSKEMGMPIEESLEDLESGLSYFRWYLDNAFKYISPEVSFENKEEIHTVYYEPVGVVAVIMPWNYPFSNLIWGTIPSLIVGNTVVFKHSEEVPIVCKKYQEIVESIGLPENILNFIYGAGEVGDTLVHADIDMIAFTGSTKTGEYLYKVAAEKFIKVVLEMGGSAPGIVFEDADLDNVVETVIFYRFGNCGQICDGLKRLIVQESVAEKLTDKLKSKVESLKIGSPIEEDTNIGPLVAEKQLTLLEEQIKDSLAKGAKIITGGSKPDNLEGFYYKPTILENVSEDMRVWKEEVFGPVLPIRTFKNYSEAIEMANDTPYGLGSYIFTNNEEFGVKAGRDLKTGMVSINGSFYVIPDDPFGGCKRSGIGREHGKWGLRELTEPKVIARYK